MIRRDVQQDSNVGTELIHIVELEAAQFNDVVIIFFALCNLECQTSSNVSSQTHIITSILEDVIDETGCCSFPIRACNTNHFGMGVSSGKLNLVDDGNPCLSGFHNHRSCFWNTWALDDFLGIQNLLFCMMPFFPLNGVLLQHTLVLWFYGTHVTDKDLKAFLECQHCCTNATFSCT